MFCMNFWISVSQQHVNFFYELLALYYILSIYEDNKNVVFEHAFVFGILVQCGFVLTVLTCDYFYYVHILMFALCGRLLVVW